MGFTWTPAAKKWLLPFPGDAWTVDTKKALACTADIKTELARAIELRANCCYAPNGNHPRDDLRPLVDGWVKAGGVAFAADVIFQLTGQPVKQDNRQVRDYRARRDFQPWARLREHLAVVSPAERAAAAAVFARHQKPKPSEQGACAAACFCDADRVSFELEAGLKSGYGRNALIGALATEEQAVAVVERLLAGTPYQLYEESVPHFPNLMVKLGAHNKALVERVVAKAWNKTVRKPFEGYLSCIGGAASPPAPPAPPAKKKKAVKKAAKKKR